MLLEVILQLDPFKVMSERNSVSALDFLGNLGGFYGALDGLVFMLGEFFSSRMFMASIASNLYMRKLSKKETKQNRKKQGVKKRKYKKKSKKSKNFLED